MGSIFYAFAQYCDYIGKPFIYAPYYGIFDNVVEFLIFAGAILYIWTLVKTYGVKAFKQIILWIAFMLAIGGYILLSQCLR